jgi:plastocyanin
MKKQKIPIIIELATIFIVSTLLILILIQTTLPLSSPSPPFFSFAQSSTQVVVIPIGAQSPSAAKFYDPPNITVAPGSTITWINNDTVIHTATSGDADTGTPDGKFDTGFIPTGKFRKIITLPQADGEIPYYCQLHPFMKGTITIEAKLSESAGAGAVGQKGNQTTTTTTTSSSTVPTSAKPIMLQGTSTNDKFKVEVNWMPNDISKENTFDIKFLDSKSGREIKGVTYDIVLLTGDKKLAETYRSAQTATQQKYNFTDQGSYILNINKINNSPAESVNIPIQVTPEFPVNMLALTAIIAALLGSTIISARWIRMFRACN